MKHLIILLAMTMIVACGKKEKDAKTQLEELRNQKAKLEEQIAKLEKDLPKSTEVKIISVTTEVLAKKPFNHYIEIQSSVVADDDVMVNAKMPGMINRVLVKVGDRVSTGQLLATIDDAITRESMGELENRLSLARDVFEKQKALWDQKIGSEIQYLTAKNNKDALEKSIATVNQTLSNFQVRAPMGGFVEEVMAKVGSTGAPGIPLMHIVNSNKLKVKADVSESLSSKIRQGSSVKLLFPDLQKELDGRINYTGKLINPTNRTFKVEASLPANSPGIIPNMVSVMRISDYSNPSAFVVPINIIQKDATGDYIMLSIPNGKQTIAKKASVKVGNINNDIAEILTGLKVGDSIITQGFLDLNDGDVLKL